MPREDSLHQLGGALPIVVSIAVNDQRGLEHGFTLTRRPPSDAHRAREYSNPSPLSLTLVTRGNLRPAITADAQGVQFFDDRGASVVNYTGLKVRDADGRVLDSRFEPAGERHVRLIVDEATARYPITINPIAQQAYLKASNTEASDWFGAAVAVSGDTVVVGAPRENSSTTGVNSTPDNAATASGAAYVFVRVGATWTQQSYLKASNTGVEDWFDATVAVSDDTVIVGAKEEDGTPNESAHASGAAYVFVRASGTWIQQAYLKGDTTGPGDSFGTAVGVSGDTVVVGTNYEAGSGTGVNSIPDENAPGSGAAYIFTLAATPLEDWRQLHFGTGANSGSGANGSDPDHDELINLIEFAFGLNPTSGSSRQLPAGQQIDNQFVVSFQQPAAASGIVYGAEWSPTMDAGSWTPVPDTGNGTTHTFSVPVGPADRKFIRLLVREQ